MAASHSSIVSYSLLVSYSLASMVGSDGALVQAANGDGRSLLTAPSTIGSDGTLAQTVSANGGGRNGGVSMGSEYSSAAS